MGNGKQVKMGQRSPKEETKHMGLVEKPINPESKGYGNLGWRNPKDLAKAHENEGLEWAGDAQKNKMGQGSPQSDGISQGSPKVVKWAKKTQNNVSTSPTIVLSYWN